MAAANRGPVSFRPGPGRGFSARFEGGAASGALAPFTGLLPIKWVSAFSGEGDRLEQERVGDASIQGRGLPDGCTARFVIPPRRMFHRYYNVICNPLLWLLHHRMWNLTHTPTIDQSVVDGWERGFAPVNQLFADGISAELADRQQPPLIMFRDYHLSLAPAMVRDRFPDALMQHVLDVPWPGPDHWEALPFEWRRQLFRGLLSNDIVGFQTARDRRSFMNCVDEFVPDAESDNKEFSIACDSRLVRLKVYPSAINPESLERIGGSARVAELVRGLEQPGITHTFARVDRAEPNKNIVRSIKGFRELLAERPDIKGTVRYVLSLAPAPPHLAQYRRYAEEITQAAMAVNQEFGRDGWAPVQLRLENNYPAAVAALKSYDTLIVTPTADGNAVSAKEGPVLNRRDGLMIISEGAGPWEKFSDIALTVAATDIAGTAQAMSVAVDMPSAQRGRIAGELRSTALAYEPLALACRQVEDLLDAAGTR
ncbi:MAG: trehalose-6-phosphate synthase [Dehalococcoidia bacterium]